MESQRSPNVEGPTAGSSEPRQRLTVVYPGQNDDGPDPEVDIVAVHGLGSNADWSWVWKDGKDGRDNVKWLEDHNMLPAKVPKARIVIYSYESKWHEDAPKTRLQLCGEELVHSLSLFRADCPERPIVFVGHSLGGNVIVRALLYAKDEDKYDRLLKATAGFVSLGTPFRGTKWQPLLDTLVRLMGPAGSYNGISKELGYDEPVLIDTLHRFCKLYYGGRWGFTGVVKGRVVEETSAHIPGRDRYTLDQDHLKMNKFSGPSDPAFVMVSGIIVDMCREAKNIVQYRFDPREIITDNKVALKHNPQAGFCLYHLSKTDPLDTKKDLKRKKGNPAAGTCQWILGTEELTAWLAPGKTSRFLWLHGNPGTGKSTLAIFLTDELPKAFSATKGRTLAYFFCDSTFDTRSTAISVVKSLLLQLVRQCPGLLKYVMPKYEERKEALFDSFHALWAIFILAAADAGTGQKYCIIDALDELEPGSQEVLLHQLMETFDTEDASPNVHILITSRPYTNIREKLNVFATKDLASFPEVKRDIQTFIAERVSKLANVKNYTTKVKNEVRKELEAKAEGTFLWIGIVCKELEKVRPKDAISCLKEMPPALDSLYKKIVDTAIEQAKDKNSIPIILQRVAVSRRPLNLLELSEACLLCLDEEDPETRALYMRDYVESCCLMIVIQDERILLLHQSVKDYLRNPGNKTSFNELEAHADFAYRCLDCVMERVGEQEKTPINLSEYAIKEWPNHARMAQGQFKILDGHANFFKIDSSEVETWRSLYNRYESSWFRLPKEFSVMHIAAKWSIRKVMEHLCDPSLNAHDIRDWIDRPDAENRTPLAYAAQSKPPDLVPLLLEEGAKVHRYVLRNAMGNSTTSKEIMVRLLSHQPSIEDYHVTVMPEGKKTDSEWIEIFGDSSVRKLKFSKRAAYEMAEYFGKELIEWLFKQRRGKIKMTQRLVEIAAANRWHGEELIEFLLEEGGQAIKITEKVVKAAARNERAGVINILLDRRGDEIKITEEVVKAAAGNWRPEVINVLLDQRGDEITITEEVVKAAAGRRAEGIDVLLYQRGDENTITEEVVEAAASNLSTEVLEILLNRRGTEIKITEGVIKAAAENGASRAMTVLLNKRGEEVKITEEVLKAAARGGGAEVMEVLFKHRGDDIEVTEEVLKVAAGNEWPPRPLMALLLKHRPDVMITEKVLKAAAGNIHGEDAMVLLLKHQPNVKITEEVLKAAAGNYWCGARLVAILLKHRADVTITKEVLKAAAGNIHGEDAMVLLLKHQPNVKLTEEVLKVAAGNYRYSARLVAILLKHQADITITEEVLKAAAGKRGNSEGVMVLLLAHQPNVKITEEVLKVAAGNYRYSARLVAILLKHQADITITEEVLKAAAGNQRDSKGVMVLLLTHQPNVKITEEVLKVAAGNEWSGEEAMAFLLRQQGNFTITEEVLEIAEKNKNKRLRKKILTLLLDQKGNETRLPEGVWQAWVQRKRARGTRDGDGRNSSDEDLSDEGWSHEDWSDGDSSDQNTGISLVQSRRIQLRTAVMGLKVKANGNLQKILTARNLPR